MPGQPPANVEYRRRNTLSFSTYQCVTLLTLIDTPKRVVIVTLASLGCSSGEQAAGQKLQLDDSSLQADHGGMGSIIRAQFGKDVLDSALHGFLSDRELIRNLLVRFASCDQSQHGDFSRCKCIIRCMLRYFV